MQRAIPLRPGCAGEVLRFAVVHELVVHPKGISTASRDNLSLNFVSNLSQLLSAATDE